MNTTTRRALEYVRNTGGQATLKHFGDDHEPIGPLLWRDLTEHGYVRVDSAGRIHLTEAGATQLKSE